MLIELEVENVKCEGCASRIKDEIGKIEEVSVLNVSVAENIVKLQTDGEGKLTLIKEELQKLGYPVKEKSSLLLKTKTYFEAFRKRNS